VSKWKPSVKIKGEPSVGSLDKITLTASATFIGEGPLFFRTSYMLDHRIAKYNVKRRVWQLRCAAISLDICKALGLGYWIEMQIKNRDARTAMNESPIKVAAAKIKDANVIT